MNAKTEIEIRKGVSIPEHPSTRYRWQEMEVGDSFLFPVTIKTAAARSTACDAGKRLGRRFSVRKTSEGLGCWRIA